MKITGREPAWVCYSFAGAMCALAVALELFLDRLPSNHISPLLPAFAAILASSSWAGEGPGLFAAGALVMWSAFDLSRHGVSWQNAVLPSLLFLVEAVVLSVGTARMWRLKRDAARSEAWHRQVVETAAEGIWVHDKQGIVTYANAKISEMLGVKDLAGRNVEEFFLPADRSVERIRAANLRDGHNEQFDRRLRRQDGAELWVLTCCGLIADPANAGKERGSLAMMTDITERKRAEYALRRSEERFRNLFEGMLEGVYQSTPEGRVLAANPMLLKMLGMANETELNDVHIAHDLYVDPNTRYRLLEQLERDGGFQNAEYELRRRDGQIITVLENARVVRDENGAVLFYEGTLTDITPRKRMEEQLRQENKVEALGRLAGDVANDFNNVLTIITGFSQLALSDLPLSHPARSSTEQVLHAAERAMALTSQLLSFSRRQMPAEGSLDLNSVIERSEAARQPGMTVSLARAPVPVYATRKQMEPIIQDLAASVRRSFPLAGLELKTELTNVDDELCRRCAGIRPGLYAVLYIGSAGGSRDEAPIQVSELFTDPFFETMQARESAAMGLSGTHAAVAQLGGFIVASDGLPAGGSRQPFHEARPGSHKISCFHVFLPCAIGLAEDSARAATAESAGETILLVENEPLVRELSRDMLERQGYRVILAADAIEAEQISGGAGSFDLLITDAVMPNITGVELARRLRTAHPGLKVLFISGYEDGRAKRNEAGAEGAAFLQKPFSADSLGRKIRQMLSQGHR